MLFQTETPITNPETSSETALVRAGDVLFGWGIALLIIGTILIIILIVFTEFKRKERESVKFSLIVIVIAGFCIGFGIDFILQYSGLW